MPTFIYGCVLTWGEDHSIHVHMIQPMSDFFLHRISFAVKEIFEWNGF